MIAGVLLSHERNRDQEFRRALPLSCIGQCGTKAITSVDTLSTRKLRWLEGGGFGINDAIELLPADATLAFSSLIESAARDVSATRCSTPPASRSRSSAS